MNDRPSGPRCAALVGPYLSGKTTLARGVAVRGRRHHAARHAEGRQHRRRPHARGARAADVDRNQRRPRHVPGRSLVLPRLPRLGRARLGSAMRHARRRRGRGGVRARARARADLGADLQVPRRQFHPAHGVHQQARHRGGAGERGAGGAAIRVGAPPGAAPGAAAGRGECDRRLCRSGERALLQIPPRASPPISSSCRTTSPTRRSKAAPACSRSSPISTTSCWNSCSRTCSPRRTRSTAI